MLFIEVPSSHKHDKEVWIPLKFNTNDAHSANSQKYLGLS